MIEDTSAANAANKHQAVPRQRQWRKPQKPTFFRSGKSYRATIGRGNKDSPHDSLDRVIPRNWKG